MSTEVTNGNPARYDDDTSYAVNGNAIWDVQMIWTYMYRLSHKIIELVLEASTARDKLSA